MSRYPETLALRIAFDASKLKETPQSKRDAEQGYREAYDLIRAHNRQIATETVEAWFNWAVSQQRGGWAEQANNAVAYRVGWEAAFQEEINGWREVHKGRFFVDDSLHIKIG